MADLRARLARVLALLDGRALDGADHVRATRLVLEMQDAGLELVERPAPLVADWRRDIARMSLAEREIAETIAAAAPPQEIAA